MAVGKYKVLEITHQQNIGMSVIAIYKLVDEKLMDFVITKGEMSKPLYIKTTINSDFNQILHDCGKRNKEIIIDLEDMTAFLRFKENYSDGFGKRDVIMHYHQIDDNLQSLKAFEDSGNLYEDCPNCRDIYLELGDSCELCGYVRIL